MGRGKPAVRTPGLVDAATKFPGLEPPEATSTPDLLRFLSRQAGRFRLRIVAASTVGGLSRGLLLATFNAAAAGAAGFIDYSLIGLFAVALSVHLLATYDAAYQGELAIRDMVQRLRLQLCEKLLFSQLRFVERQGPSDIYAHISADIALLGQSAIVFLRNLQAAVVLAFALAYLGWLSLPGLVAAVVTIVVSAAVYTWQDRKAMRLLSRARVREDEFFEGVYDLVQGFKELKLNRAQHVELAANLRDVSDDYRRLSVSAGAMYHVSLVTSQAFLFGLVAVLVFVLPPLFPSSSVTIFQFLATVLFIIGPVEQLVSSTPQISRARIAHARVKALERDLERDSGVPAEREMKVEPLSFDTIALKGVHYSFETAGGEETFDLGPIDLELKRGEVLFICGGNGAGKTTLLKLLMGLYYPATGEILIDGRRLAPHEHQRYREMFMAIFSDFYLFRRLYGIADPDPSYVDELLAEMQIQHKTRLKNRVFTSINLSAGQRKRLAYAVSRLHDRQVYVFDEFAADQDPGFRRYFYSVILPELKRQGKTVVAVTHDDRWFTAGDRLIKLDYGKISEQTLTSEAV